MIKIRKKLYYAIPVIIFAIIIFIMPKESIKLTKNGIFLWATIVLPAIFPFMVASGVFIRCGIVNDIAKVINPITYNLFGTNGYGGYCLIMSAISGYPMGAYTISELYHSGKINTRDAENMMTYCSTSGPLFIIAGVGTGMFGDSSIGYLLLIVHLISAVTCGIFFKSVNKFNLTFKISDNIKEEYLSKSIEKAVSTCLIIGGYIALFSVINGLLINGLKNILPQTAITNYITSIVSGIVEMTNGCAVISDLDRAIALPLTAAALGWGGLSISLQQLSLLLPTGVSAKKFFIARLAQTIFSYCICNIYQLFTGNKPCYAITLSIILILIVLLPRLSTILAYNKQIKYKSN